VIDSVQITALEIQDRAGHWYDLQIHPYKTIENKIDGAVLVFINIDVLKRGLSHVGARDYLEAILETCHEPFLILDSSFRVMMANQSFLQDFQDQRRKSRWKSIF
jgi:two-component system, chemotaxis family, CheB/CheR fusion protein